MLLSTKDGYACDQCGLTHRHDFTYYSFDFRSVSISQNRKPSLDQILHFKVVFSLDVCPACFEKVKTTIIEQYAKIMSPQRRVRIETVCELTGKVLVGTYNYYYVDVTEVEVKITSQPAVCTKCKQKTFDDKSPCTKCKGTSFVRPASTASKPRIVEFSVCEDMYKKLTESAATVRQVAGEWSTRT